MPDFWQSLGWDFAHDAGAQALVARGGDVLRVIGGTADVVVGVTLTLGSSGLAVVPGVALIAVGLDQVVTGATNLVSGQQSLSVVEFGGYSGAKALGTTDDQAQFIGGMTPLVLSVAFAELGALAQVRMVPQSSLAGQTEWLVRDRALAERVVRNLEARYASETGVVPQLGAVNGLNPQTRVIILNASEPAAFRLGYRAEELHHWMQIRQLEAQTGRRLFGRSLQEIEREIPGFSRRIEADVLERLRRSGFTPYNSRNYAPYTDFPRPPGVAGN